ncbi:MAG: hypothetical protein COU08_02140 [Candidatus Harrisonbacteria bacterium CG10_big_fil_rev_8_21_14_0_10_42_17]|uniref:DUF2127 domain-containing protein n=1 Tax=Candidatus Harrisonbacteria bacterium CG10_big_fil_rev_8_21_14_0_10_42_17 TaxID=1974584 RepID=A0A2M6WI67_9BACT|nr:MAG: hypothetical protein COU08_02140 [Candidatus Harrisonbacteria bacterium CG10_big_fil_rev_8_21_14_0_10_42_17]
MKILDSLRLRDTTRVRSLFFRVGMWWRIFYGFLRFLLGFVLLHLIGMPVADVFYSIMAHELIEDKTDFLVRVVTPFLRHSSFTVTYFLAIYFIFWGFIDIVLSINLLRRKLWAFPLSLYLISIFVVYEIYRFSYTHSLVLAYIVLVDFVLLWLIRKEYLSLTRVVVRTNHA